MINPGHNGAGGGTRATRGVRVRQNGRRHRAAASAGSRRAMTLSKTFTSTLCVVVAVGTFASSVLLLSTPALAAVAAQPSPAGSASLKTLLKRLGPVTPASIADSPGVAEVDPTGVSSTTGLSQPMAGVSAFSSTFQDTFQCTDKWEYVAARKNSYVTGNCHSGWKIARTTRDYEPTRGTGQGYWDGGYINGSYDGCGWMRQVDSTLFSSDDTTRCGSPDQQNCAFMFCDAAHPDGTIFGGPADGQSLPLTRNCPEAANYQPWSNTPHPTTAGAADGVILRWGLKGQRMLVRYIAKAPWSGYYFAMVRDPAITVEGQANWVFMQSVCFT
jgi:hypothetical protein